MVLRLEYTLILSGCPIRIIFFPISYKLISYLGSLAIIDVIDHWYTFLVFFGFAVWNSIMLMYAGVRTIEY